MKHSLPITDRDNIGIVEKRPTSHLATEHAHVASTSKDGHSHEAVVHIERVVKFIKTHDFRQRNQSPEYSISIRALFTDFCQPIPLQVESDNFGAISESDFLTFKVVL